MLALHRAGHYDATIGERFAARSNNFDLLRLMAAILVLLAHSYFATGQFDNPFSRTIGWYGGDLAVSVFFVISGFLVTRSLLDNSIKMYIASRALRIIPALALVTAFDVFLIGAVFTKMPLDAYLSAPLTLHHLRNVFVFGFTPFLPGVFGANLHQAVNGPLWTLPMEASIYLMLPLLLAIGALRAHYFVWVAFAVLAAHVASFAWLGLSLAKEGGLIMASVPTYSFLHYATFFALGAAMWVYRDKVPLSWGIALCLLILTIVGSGMIFGRIAFIFCVSYFTICIAMLTPAISLKRIGDLSYGVYLFCFPIQQSIIHLSGGKIGSTMLSALALPLALLAAFVSWRLVERPAMKLKLLLQQRQRYHHDDTSAAGPGVMGRSGHAS